MTEINYTKQTEHPFFAAELKSKYEGQRWKAKTSISFFFKRQPCVCALTCGDKCTVISGFSSSEDGKYFCAFHSNSYSNVGHLSRFCSIFSPSNRCLLEQI